MTVKTKPTLAERAMKSVVRRIIGSFGYRAVQSLDGGFSPTENLAICKQLEMAESEISNSVDLYVDSMKPLNTDIKAIAAGMDCTQAEAKVILAETQADYDEALARKPALVTQLTDLFKKAKGITAVSDFAHENIKRVTEKALSQARSSYMRTGDSEWVKAVRTAVTTVNDAFTVTPV